MKNIFLGILASVLLTGTAFANGSKKGRLKKVYNAAPVLRSGTPKL
jgi:hypothetical protein